MCDLISKLSELRSQYSCFNEGEQEVYHALSEAIEAMKKQKTGKWLSLYVGDAYKDYWACSKCRSIFKIKTNFCPYCGAKMENSQ